MMLTISITHTTQKTGITVTITIMMKNLFFERKKQLRSLYPKIDGIDI